MVVVRPAPGKRDKLLDDLLALQQEEKDDQLKAYHTR